MLDSSNACFKKIGSSMGAFLGYYQRKVLVQIQLPISLFLSLVNYFGTKLHRHSSHVVFISDMFPDDVLQLQTQVESESESKDEVERFVYTAEHEQGIDVVLGRWLKEIRLCTKCFELRVGECQDCKVFASVATLLGNDKVPVGRYNQEECAICKNGV